MPEGCPYPAILISFQNSPQKLAKIHLRAAVVRACNTMLPAS